MTDMMRKGVVDVSIFNGTEYELMLGQVAALSGRFNALFSQIRVSTYY